MKTKLKTRFVLRSALFLSILLVFFGCGSNSPAKGQSIFDLLARCFEPTLNAADLCDPQKVTFSLNSTNPYYPLHVGLQTILEGEEDGELLRVERTVLADTQVVSGVTTRILEHKSYINGEIHEIARNFYVEASNGTVCYFGEDVEFYEDGALANLQGTWRAEGDAKPGIIMPAMPAVGQGYFQEGALGIAEDMGRVTSTTETREYAGISYDNVVIVQDSNPIDTEATCVEEEKAYVAGIGEVADVGLELVSFTPGA
ncbi:MAG: hypothetical protein R3A13_00370 [Bdellovibrionota bacterium]